MNTSQIDNVNIEQRYRLVITVDCDTNSTVGAREALEDAVYVIKRELADLKPTNPDQLRGEISYVEKDEYESDPDESYYNAFRISWEFIENRS